jgi:sulfotransferase family protein
MAMAKGTLDFLLIGAQKAGTTSLYEYLRTHPGIYMPPGKDVSFFNLEGRMARGWSRHVELFFGGAPLDTFWGTVNVFYMDGTEKSRRPVSPALLDSRPTRSTGKGWQPPIQERIHETLPDVKLIAVLRDPVARCISHFRMTVMKRLEYREFESTMVDLLEHDALEESRCRPSQTNSYITRGEYGRILSAYLDVFPANQLLVVFCEELERDPREVLRSIFSFVGADPEFAPPKVGERFREGGERRRVSWLDPHDWRQRLAAFSPPRTLWEALPDETRRQVDRIVRGASYRIELWNAHRGMPAPEIDPSVLSALAEHYREDSRLLGDLLGNKPPWLAPVPAPAQSPRG